MKNEKSNATFVNNLDLRVEIENFVENVKKEKLYTRERIYELCGVSDVVFYIYLRDILYAYVIDRIRDGEVECETLQEELEDIVIEEVFVSNNFNVEKLNSWKERNSNSNFVSYGKMS